MIRTYETDYSTTVIYKIYCKDTTIKELYVGHTTDFVRRKKSHQANCNNVNTTIKLYTFIREHGGWDNWIMEVISFFNCKDLSEARQKEQEFFVLLGATLNSIEPYPRYNKENKDKSIEIESVRRETTNTDINNIIVDDKKREDDNIRYACKECNVSCRKLNNLNYHLATARHKRQTSRDEKEDRKSLKTYPKPFYCEKCDYECYNKKDFSKHLSTRKHSADKMDNQKVLKSPLTYSCSTCNKTYKYKSGLCKHKKTCTQTLNGIIREPTDDMIVLTNLVKELVSVNHNIVKQNEELQNKLLDWQIKKDIRR